MNKTPICGVPNLRITDTWFTESKKKPEGDLVVIEERAKFKKPNTRKKRKFKVIAPDGTETPVNGCIGLSEFFTMGANWGSDFTRKGGKVYRKHIILDVT